MQDTSGAARLLSQELRDRCVTQGIIRWFTDARAGPGRGKLRPPFRFEETFLAKPNYSFEKRQREIARKKKQDEKRQRKVKTAPDEASPVEQQPQPSPPTTDTAV